MSAATPAGLPSRVAIRWYQLTVIVLGVALAAVTVLAVYLAVNDTAAAAVPATAVPNTTTSEPGDSGTAGDHPCWRIHTPC